MFSRRRCFNAIVKNAKDVQKSKGPKDYKISRCEIDRRVSTGLLFFLVITRMARKHYPLTPYPPRIAFSYGD
jgi:hypothetical protein